MDGVILSQLTAEAFVQVVADAFRQYRRSRQQGDLLPLTESILAGSPLVAEALLEGEPMTLAVQAQGMQALLHWAVDQLQPGGQPSFTAVHWRSYHVLFYPYLAGWTFNQLSEVMGLSEQGVFKARRRALEAVAHLLHQELKERSDISGRRQYLVETRYQSLTTTTQTALHLLAAFATPIPLKWWQQMLAQWPLPTPDNWESLPFVLWQEAKAEVSIHEGVRSFLQSHLSLTEQTRIHHIASHFYQQAGNYLQAIHHLSQQEPQEEAALLLIEQYQTIIHQGQIEALKPIIATFRQLHLTEMTWIRLKVAAGDVAMLAQDVKTAVVEYGLALGASDPYWKALAYYRRAKAFHSQNLDEAIAHYDFGIHLLAEAESHPSLLVEMYIDRAWFYMQDRPNLAKAALSLQQAQTSIDKQNRAQWANLHNAWAGLYYFHQDTAQEFYHRQQAWLAANDAQQKSLMIKTAHNLGQAYMRDKAYEQALIYLQKAQQFAQQTGDRQKEGMCYKTMGACCFWLKAYEAAITFYEQAYHIFEQTGNRNWLGRVCYDLTEAYAEIGETEPMQQYFAQGIAIAQALNAQQLLQAMNQLARYYPGLMPIDTTLNERQRLAFDYIKQHGAITNKAYRGLVHVSPRTAVRDLEEMVEEGILQKEGQGRGTHYTLN